MWYVINYQYINTFLKVNGNPGPGSFFNQSAIKIIKRPFDKNTFNENRPGCPVSVNPYRCHNVLSYGYRKITINGIYGR